MTSELKLDNHDQSAPIGRAKAEADDPRILAFKRDLKQDVVLYT